MVAIRGPGWGLAPCLVDLIAECDELAPNRSTVSDGSIGDVAHSARTSDHNPDDGWVCAVDVTDDKAGGCDADLLARHIVASRDPRVKYVIWNGTIAKSYASNGHRAWEPQPYTGLNAHEKHTHVSVHNTSAARNDLSPWWPQNEPPVAPLEDDDMPLILKADGQPARLFAPPVFVPLDGPSADALRKAGVREVVVTKDDYMEIRQQILDALGRT